MSRVDLESQDWKQCCDIIDYLIGIGDSEILGECIRCACSNSEEAMNCIIGQYNEVLENDDY